VTTVVRAGALDAVVVEAGVEVVVVAAATVDIEIDDDAVTL
jgi:hypothetical protein